MIESRRQVLRSQHSNLYLTSRNAVAAVLVVATVAVLLMLGGCATGGGSQSSVVNPADIIGQPSAYTMLKAPPTDKALVCFLRRSSFVGLIVPWFFIEYEKIICTLPNATYYHLLVNPGTHTFSFKAGPSVKERFTTMELKGGQIYCFLGTLSGQMELVTPEQANELIPKLTFRKQDGD
jgi:hypothetical protein